MDDFWLFFTIGIFLVVIFVGWLQLHSERTDCQRENNVYKCERVYIPVEGE